MILVRAEVQPVYALRALSFNHESAMKQHGHCALHSSSIM
jgi:hypothetical protein